MADIEEFLRQNERKDLLRFATAGSIDDGKSTLIGRLLHDSRNVYEDHLASLRRISKERASDEKIDLALLTDGLRAEREQGITIDVAYRYFSTPRRKFIIADTPGHEQYTRNMATGASTANLALILVDARNGVVTQTRRHAFIASLLGVPHIALVVNKMDLVGYSEEAFQAIRQEFEAFAARLNIVDLRFVPVSALRGDNVVSRSSKMRWYNGPSLLELLETIYIGGDHNLIDLRYPVQYVLRPHMDFRGYAGTVASGIIRAGDEILALPSMKTSRVKSITTWDGELNEAFPPMSVAVTLEDELDVGRGDMLTHIHNRPRMERRFEAMVVWMGDAPMDMNTAYYIKHTTQVTRARIDEVIYRVDVNTLKRIEAAPLRLNETGRVAFTSLRPLLHDPYTKNRATGSFILIDPVSNATAAAGMIIDREPVEQMPTRPAAALAVPSVIAAGDGSTPLLHERERAARYGQRPVTLWLTGLASCGKKEIAYLLDEKLFQLGAVCVVLDGLKMRLGLDRELDFSPEGMAEHIRRAAETARILNESGLMVIGVFVSPFASLRRMAADIVGNERFLEVFVDAPVEWCVERDSSGLYRRARSGELRGVAGVDIPYEPSASPYLRIRGDRTEPAEAVELILSRLRQDGIFPCVESGRKDAIGKN